MNQCYARKIGTTTFTSTDAADVVAGITGKQFSIARVFVAPSAAAISAGQTVAITGSSAAALTPAFPTVICGAEPFDHTYEPGEYTAAVSAGIAADPSTTDSVTISIEVYYI